MVLLIIIPFLNGYFIGNTTFSDKPIFFGGIFDGIVEPQTFRFNGVYWDLMVI